MEKGVCKEHGEFVLTEGCPLCLAEKRGGADCHISDFAPKPGSDVEVVNYYDQALRLKEYAESRVIRTIEDIRIATDDLSIISRLKKAMAEKKKEYLAPHQEQIKAINDNYKLWMEPVETADSITRDKIMAFNREQEDRRRKQEEINRKRMEAAQEEAALNNGEISEPVNLIEVTEAPKRVSTEMGTTGMAKIWKFEVTDFSLLPDRFKMENATLIGKVVRAGEREIPGVRIWSEDTLRVTTK